MITNARRRELERAALYNIAAAARLILDAPSDYPNAYTYVAQHNALPSRASNYGPTRVLKTRAAHLRKHLGELEDIVFLPPRPVSAAFDHLPPSAVLPLLRFLVDESPLRPAVGLVCPEWSRSAGWHYHAVLSTADAQNIRDRAAADGLGDVLPGAYSSKHRSEGGIIRSQENLRYAVRYCTKSVRRDPREGKTPEDHQLDLAAHADMMIRFQQAHGGRLPWLTWVYG